MGVLDIPKMIAQARELQKKAKAVIAAGRSGAVSILLNGLIEWEEEMVNEDMVMESGKFQESEREAVKKVIDILKRDFRGAFKDAKKQIEKKMGEGMDKDEVMGMMEGLKSGK